LLIGLLISACQRIETRKEKYPSGKLKARWEVTVSKEGEMKDGVYEEFYERLLKEGMQEKKYSINKVEKGSIREAMEIRV